MFSLLDLSLQIFLLRSNETRELSAIERLEKLLIAFADQYDLPIHRDNNKVKETSNGSFHYYNMPYSEYKQSMFNPISISLKEEYENPWSSTTTLAHEIGHFLQYRLGINFEYSKCEDYANQVLLSFIKRLSNEDKLYLHIIGYVCSDCKDRIKYFKIVDFDVFDYVCKHFKIKTFGRLPMRMKRKLIEKAFISAIIKDDDEED